MPTEMRLEWISNPPEEMAQKVDRKANNLASEVAAAMQPVAGEVTAFMKGAHPWTNRTGAAEAGLNTTVAVADSASVSVTVASQAAHGIWLETKAGGKWGIIPKGFALAQELVGQAIQKVLSSW